jgi:hypothetical protein
LYGVLDDVDFWTKTYKGICDVLEVILGAQSLLVALQSINLMPS